MEVPEHGQMVGTVMEALEEDGGVEGLLGGEGQHVLLHHGQPCGKGAAPLDQFTELIVDLHRGDPEAGGHQVAGEVPPTRAELDDAIRRTQSAGAFTDAAQGMAPRH